MIVPPVLTVLARPKNVRAHQPAYRKIRTLFRNERASRSSLASTSSARTMSSRKKGAISVATCSRACRTSLSETKSKCYNWQASVSPVPFQHNTHPLIRNHRLQPTKVARMSVEGCICGSQLVHAVRILHNSLTLIAGYTYRRTCGLHLKRACMNTMELIRTGMRVKVD
mgnify:FL=1